MPSVTLLVEQIFARVPGGTGRYSREVAAALGATQPQGWQLRSASAWHRNLRPGRIPGVQGPRPLPLDVRLLSRLWARGLPPLVGGTVVHALTPLAPGRLRRGQSLVVTVHDAVPFTHPETLTPHGAAWHRAMIGQAAATAAAIVVPTAAVAADLAAAGVGGHVQVIGEGVSGALAGPVDAVRVQAARTRLGLPERYAVTVGTLEPRKGLDVLLDALAGNHPASGAPVHLAVIGQPGWGGSDLAEQSRRRGIAERVHVLGRLPDADLAAVLAGAAVSVTPSRSEGFGLPLLEAMARGVPVVHTDAPALVEVAGGAGLTVPVGNAAALAAALQEVLGDPRLSASMSAAGRARAQDHSWAAVADQLWQLYATVTVQPRI